VRRAMVHGLDRQTLVETLQYGLTTPADILAPPDDPIYKLVEERGLARYPYDLARADQLLNEAGWAKGQDGVYQRGGQQFTAEIRSVVVSPDNDREMLAISDQWKTAGFVSPIFRIPNEVSPADKDEGRAKTEGVFVLPLENSPESLGDYHSSQIATEATRWRGNNRGGFSNPTYDRLYDEYISTLDVPKRNGLLADIQKLTADEVVYIPLAYDFGPFTSAVRKGIRGPGPLKPIQQANTWNVHTWEID